MLLLRRLFVGSLVALLFFLSACGVVAAAQVQSTRLTDQEVADYVHSGNYNRDLVKQLALAKDYLDLRVNLNNLQHQHQRLAMVVAVDNTALADEARLKKLFVHLPMASSETWPTDEPVIWAFRAFYDYAQAKGVDIFFVTSRPQTMREQTLHNLQREGYTHFKGLYMHSLTSRTDEVEEKVKERSDIERHGYSIILNVSSRLAGLKGGHSSRVVLLPDPGSHAPRPLHGLNTLG